MYIKNKIAQKR